jgi:sulfocyanin SoxE-like protein
MTTGAAVDTAPVSSAAQESSSVAPDTATAVKPQKAALTPDTKAKAPVKPSVEPARKKTPSTQPAASSAPTDSAVAPASASADSAAPASGDAAGQDQNLKYDAKSNTVTFQLIGGPSGFQFNGHGSGSATLTLPPNANVVINFINKDGTPHSAEVIPGEGAIPNSGGDPALPRAYTNQLIQGLPQEGTDVMKFAVPASGTYRIFCGVPGHGLSGMWIWMKVDPAAKAPTFGPTKS